MIKDKTNLPFGCIEKVIRKHSEFRVSKDAVDKLREIIEQKLKDLSINSSKIAKYNDRKTIKKEDFLIVDKI